MFISRSDPASETAFEDRRRSVRHAALDQVAKIRLASGREELCLLRDISDEGVRAEVYIPLATGDTIDVEFRTAHSAAGRIAWVAGNEIGVAFASRIPAAAMLAHCSFEVGRSSLRPPRLTVRLRGLLRMGTEALMVNIGNISQAGLQIEAPAGLKAGSDCSIALPGLSARAATVCWLRDGNAGLLLVEPFDYPSFAAWRARSR